MAIYGKTPVLMKITLMYMAVRVDHNSVAEIQDKFNRADLDENGRISKEEFNLIIAQATGGQTVPMQSTDMMFEILDTNKSGNIEFSEFKAVMLRTCLHLHEQSVK